jgi:hypothetical protein
MRSPWGSAPRGSQLDHWVDRPDVETWQHAKLTGTNKPTTCPHLSVLRVHCAVPEIRSGTPEHLHKVTAVIASGKRPVPFRTRKLSPSAPMVLRGKPRGRVGRRRTPFQTATPPPAGWPSPHASDGAPTPSLRPGVACPARRARRLRPIYGGTARRRPCRRACRPACPG